MNKTTPNKLENTSIKADETTAIENEPIEQLESVDLANVFGGKTQGSDRPGYRTPGRKSRWPRW
jgi:hypothetical protein